MDAVEKRVLRRHSAAIVDQLRLTEGVTVQGYRQGLMDYQGLVSVLEFRRNADRVMQFLELVEEVRPAAFEKLCYFLENHGNSRLCDELWAELILERGHLRLDLNIVDEVRHMVRQRLNHAKLSPQDLEEITVMIAKKFQKEALTRLPRNKSDTGQNSGSTHSIHGVADLSQQVDFLCSELEQCIGVVSSDGDRKPGSTEKSDIVQGKIVNLKGGKQLSHQDSKADWLKQLKQKLTNLSDTYVAPEQISVRDKGTEIGFSKESRGKQEVVTNSNNQGADPQHFQAHIKDAQSGTHMNVGNHRSITGRSAIATKGAGIAGISGATLHTGGHGTSMQDLCDTLDITEDRGSVRLTKGPRGGVSQTRINQLINPNVKLDKKGRPEGKGGRGGSSGKRGSQPEADAVISRGRSQLTAKERKEIKARLERERSKAAAKAKKQGDQLDIELPEYHILTEGEEAELQKEVHALHRSKHHITNMRRAVSGVLNSHLAKGLTKLEDAYWDRRCDLMKRCQATGYYYFLSSHKRHRCRACHHTGHTPFEQCSWFDPEFDPVAVSRLPSPQINKGQLNLYKGSSFADHHDLPNEYFAANKKFESVRFDDCDCPGAVQVPGQTYKRCLACAYANDDLSRFYDAAVSTEGSYHFSFPVVDKLKHKHKATVDRSQSAM